jgi:hypothetical protein
MLQPGLEHRAVVAHHLIQLLERAVVQVQLAELLDPESLLAEQVEVAGQAAGEGEPLHVVG